MRAETSKPPLHAKTCMGAWFVKPIDTTMAEFGDKRRAEFVNQVRRDIGPKLSGLTTRQSDLNDASLTRLFRKGRLLSNQEIESRLELITEHVSPTGHEVVQRVYWDLRLNPKSENME